MSHTETIPYVVSADVGGLMGRWATANGLVVPSDAYFADLSYDLSVCLGEATDSPIEVVSEAEMRGGMNRLIDASTSPVVSLDRAYIEEDHPNVAGFIDVTRAVRHETAADGTTNFVSAGGLLARPGYPAMNDQLEALRADRSSPVTLVDDVIFNGDGAVDLAERLKKVNRPVKRVIAGIGIATGINRIAATGIEVDCVRTFAEVADEVCERDFVACVPMSGRTVVGENNTHWSAPYFLPYGNPEGWATIPTDRCREFSRFCLKQSVALWSEVERLSGVRIPAHAVPRPLYGADGQSSVTMLLRQDLAKL